MKLLNDRILVRPNPVSKKIGSIIVNLDKDDSRPTSGEVIAVGPGRYVKDKLIPPSVKVGDKLIWGTYCGDDVEVEGESLLLLEEKEIMAVYS